MCTRCKLVVHYSQVLVKPNMLHVTASIPVDYSDKTTTLLLFTLTLLYQRVFQQVSAWNPHNNRSYSLEFNILKILIVHFKY